MVSSEYVRNPSYICKCTQARDDAAAIAMYAEHKEERIGNSQHITTSLYNTSSLHNLQKFVTFQCIGCDARENRYINEILCFIFFWSCHKILIMYFIFYEITDIELRPQLTPIIHSNYKICKNYIDDPSRIIIPTIVTNKVISKYIMIRTKSLDFPWILLMGNYIKHAYV